MRCFFFTIMVLFASCAQNSYKLSEKEKLADQALEKAAIQLKLEKNLYLLGTGGKMLDEIKELTLLFAYYKPIEIEEGRELLVAATDKLISIVNADERVRLYLSNFPFTEKNIGIQIYVKNSDGSEVSLEKLCVITAQDGHLTYKKENPNGLFFTIHKETYEEALTKLSKQTLKKSA